MARAAHGCSGSSGAPEGKPLAALTSSHLVSLHSHRRTFVSDDCFEDLFYSDDIVNTGVKEKSEYWHYFHLKVDVSCRALRRRGPLLSLKVFTVIIFVFWFNTSHVSNCFLTFCNHPVGSPAASWEASFSSVDKGVSSIGSALSPVKLTFCFTESPR